MTISVERKESSFPQFPTLSVQGCSSAIGHLMALSTKTSSTPTPLSYSLFLSLSRHYRHHCPQNGWQLIEITGCVTTPRCTCCAIYVAPVLMPQQPERQRKGSCLQQHKRPINVGPYCIKATGPVTSLKKQSIWHHPASGIWNNYLGLLYHVINFPQNSTEEQRKHFCPLLSTLMSHSH